VALRPCSDILTPLPGVGVPFDIDEAKERDRRITNLELAEEDRREQQREAQRSLDEQKAKLAKYCQERPHL
jgi:hypothetical protein